MNDKRLTIISIVAVLALAVYSGSTFISNVFATTATTATTNATNATSSSSGVNQQNISSNGKETSHLRVLVSFEVKEGKKQELLNNIVPNLNSTRSEEGNISFELLASTQNPNEFLIDQHWSSKAAYDKHHNNPLSVRMNEIINNLSVNPPVFKTYAEINAIQ